MHRRIIELLNTRCSISGVAGGSLCTISLCLSVGRLLRLTLSSALAG